MLLKLSPKEIIIFKDLECDSAAKIKETLLKYGVKVGANLSKNQLLERFYQVLLENFTAQKGVFT